MEISELQQRLDEWIKTYGVRYFSELTNMAVLTEEVGELARIMARRYGDQSAKSGEECSEERMAEEMADIIWVVTCLANQTGVDLTAAIEASGGVKLLDVDPGEATNRTVVTFVGEPEAVVEAAFAGVKRAAELLDMRRHKGAHPRMGATDVLPLIPIAGVTLAECAELARALARRIADELRIPTYCYEAAAFAPERKNLAVCRAGEYEALPEKLAHAETAPDFGARPFDEGVARTGATTVGARDFLIAVNFNLNTTSTRRANAIAFDVREKGRPVREGNPITGRVVKDAAGNPVMQPGTLPATKAIGWYIEEYGIAQVSMNITDLSVTPLHVAFDEVCRKADARGVRVTGTEIVGLVPKRALVEAGRHFLRKQRRSTGIAEEEIVRIARHIGTFETSILPYEDCCTVFTPRHPKTRPHVEEVREMEQALDVEGLVRRAMDGREVVKLR